VIAFSCPVCDATLRASEDKAGGPTKCPRCGCSLHVPVGSSPAPPAPTVTPVPSTAALVQTVNFQCVRCKKLMTVGIDHLGQQVQCPHCGQVLAVPRLTTTPPSGESVFRPGDVCRLSWRLLLIKLRWSARLPRLPGHRRLEKLRLEQEEREKAAQAGTPMPMPPKAPEPKK
jgi:DNA-directed RNA polymerase subunit RPC12/RpoP